MNRITDEELQSATIDFLRFPLIIGVILIHSHINSMVVDGVDIFRTGYFPLYTAVSFLLSDVFARIAVPLFFFISGYLFFYKTAFFTWQTYGRKLRKRARTLLVPYLFWNAAVIAFLFLAQTFLSGLLSGSTKLVCDYAWSDWLKAFWSTASDTGPGFPICYQLWFLRDLIVVVLFSPLVFLLIKWFRQYAVLGMGLLWLYIGEINLTGLSITAFFFFSAGAYFSINGKNLVAAMKPYLGISGILYGLLAVAELFLREYPGYFYLHRINILFGVVLVITLTARFIERGTWRVNRFLSNSSFFLYAFHGIFLAFLIKLLFQTIRPDSDAMVLTLYVTGAAAITLISLLLYYLLRKYFPKTTALITGGR